MCVFRPAIISIETDSSFNVNFVLSTLAGDNSSQSSPVVSNSEAFSVSTASPMPAAVLRYGMGKVGNML